MPMPEFRAEERICIEHLYKDEDMMLKTDSGLRIFKNDEFDKKTGLHNTDEGVVRLYPNNTTLIVDSGVMDVINRKNIALTKARFAEMIEGGQAPFADVSFDGFEPLLNIFEKLHSDYLR
jgi:RNA-directed DNA polymerase